VRAGEATWNKAMLLLLERSGFREETYHSFSYSPLREKNGSVGGLLCIVNEETRRVIGERRLETLRSLGSALAEATSRKAILEAAQRAFADNRRDFPFIALHLAAGSDQNGDDAMLAQVAAILPDSPSDSGEIVALPSDVEWPSGEWQDQPDRAVVIAIPASQGTSAGTLTLGLNPYRGDDPDIIDLARLIAGQIGGALAAVAAVERERRRTDRMWSLSRDLTVAIDSDGVFQSVSPSWTRILGHPVDNVIGHRFEEFIHPDDLGPSTAALADALIADDLTDYENRFQASDGSYHRIEWHTTLEGGLVYAYGRDVTERRIVEARLSQSEEQFRHLVQGVTDYAIYMIDLEGHVSSWNEGARRIKGYEPDEIMGKHFLHFYTPEDRKSGEPGRALETARREGRFNAEGWRVRKNGERFRASVVIDAIRDDEGRPIGFAKITRDITERDAAQRALEAARESLFQSQKMEAIGQLTGGVAHDFNNLLMAVMGSLDLLRRRIPDDAMSQRLVNNAIEGAQRGATLTQRMLAFARRQELKVDHVDLTRLLAGMNDLVQRSIGPEWPISISFPLKLPAVKADANQLEMALLNLVVNARDASPGGGAIVISASCEDIKVTKSSSLAAGTYVRLAVKDQGTGMDKETLRRATEPFFTTKGVGKGTGLGLPMVHGMAQQIGGTFELLSEVGHGTSAVLWMPAADDQPAPASEPAPLEELQQQTKRLKILAVDDDALVLLNTAALLEDLGHEVIEAHSGDEAVAAFQRDPHVDLLITDQAMPHMTGADLVAAIDAISPGIPVIIASGYGEGVAISDREVVRLGKPFNQARLSAAIVDALGADAL
ncbi:PAS domain S-box protein, partial [Sphingobium sp.]|uniref:hybrid sensor histidine kinase/response regulator n=1 Tax=Sphingobium sp. TaxID=1912891 RepID=UPI002C86A538